jgi:hypothetical protein
MIGRNIMQEYSSERIQSILSQPQFKISYVGLRYGSIIYFLLGKISSTENKLVSRGELEIEVLADEWSLTSASGNSVVTNDTAVRILIEEAVSPLLTGASLEIFSIVNGLLRLNFSNGYLLSILTPKDNSKPILELTLDNNDLVDIFPDGRYLNVGCLNSN